MGIMMNQMTEPMPQTEVPKRPSLRRESDHNKRPNMQQNPTQRPGLLSTGKQTSFRGGLDKIQAFAAANRPGLGKETSFRLDKIQGLINQANQAMTALSDHAINASGLVKAQINLDGKDHESFMSQSDHTASMSSSDSEGLSMGERVAAACSSSAEARRRAAEELDSDVFRSTLHSSNTTANRRLSATARLSASIMTAPSLSVPSKITGEEPSFNYTSHITGPPANTSASSRLSQSSTTGRRQSLNLPTSKSLEVQASLRRANTASVRYRRSLSRSKTSEEGTLGKESSLKKALKLKEERSEAINSANNRRQALFRNKTYDERCSNSRTDPGLNRRSSLSNITSANEFTNPRLNRRSSLRNVASSNDCSRSGATSSSLKKALQEDRKCTMPTASSHGRRIGISRRQSSRNCLYDIDADTSAVEQEREETKRRSSVGRSNEPQIRRSNTTTGSTRPSRRRSSTGMKRSMSTGNRLPALRDMPKEKASSLLDVTQAEKGNRSSRQQHRRASTGGKSGKSSLDHVSKHKRSISKSKEPRDESRTRDSSTANRDVQQKRRGSTTGGGRRHCKTDSKDIATKLSAMENAFVVESKTTPNTPAA